MTSTTVKTPGLEGKKDVQKLQRAIIDGLEDVKAQDIQVFDTEHITSLFERVIVASGTSNRQTKALAASVRDAVRDAGFAKPRIEGEENGEWIIVDCGAAVAHIMQPTIRQYYNLEELWGDKPVKLKLGAPAPLAKATKTAKAESEAEAKPAKARAGAKAKPAAKSAKAAKEGDAQAKPARKKAAGTDDGTYAGRVGKTHDWTAERNATELAEEPAPAPVKRARAASKTAVKAVAAAATEAAAAKPVAAKKVAAKRASAKTAAGEPVTAKAPAKKAPAKTPVVVIPDTKKVAARKTAVKAAIKTAAAKKAAVKKPAAKKTAPRSE